MKRELRDKWCEALESGNYKQGTKRLRKDGKYCCLGVLCDVAGLGWVNIDDEYFATYGECVDNVRVGDFVKILGLNNAEESRLIKLNDILSYNFKQISEFIKENVSVEN